MRTKSQDAILYWCNPLRSPTTYLSIIIRKRQQVLKLAHRTPDHATPRALVSDPMTLKSKMDVDHEVFLNSTTRPNPFLFQKCFAYDWLFYSHLYAARRLNCKRSGNCCSYDRECSIQTTLSFDSLFSSVSTPRGPFRFSVFLLFPLFRLFRLCHWSFPGPLVVPSRRLWMALVSLYRFH